MRLLQCRKSAALTLGVEHFFEFLPYLEEDNFFGRYFNLFASSRISRLSRFPLPQTKVAKTPYLDLIPFDESLLDAFNYRIHNYLGLSSCKVAHLFSQFIYQH